MNSYTVHFRYAREHVDATDSDMAVMPAEQIIAASGLSDEDRGELVAIELWDAFGSGSTFFYAGDYDADSAAEIVNRDQMWAPQPSLEISLSSCDIVMADNGPSLQPRPALPPRRYKGLTLSFDGGDGEAYVQRLGYSGSLLAAAHEGELWHSNPMRDPLQLSAAEMDMCMQWLEREDEYRAQL